MRNIVLFLAGAAILSACAQTPPPPPPPPPAPAVDVNSTLYGPTFLAHAGSGGMFEIQAGQLALQRSTNPAVRSLAQMLVTDHTALANRLAAAAQAGGVTPPPPGMLAEAQQMWTQLQSAPPQSFDTTFRDLVIQEHQHGIPMFQNYAANGDNAALRAAAGQALPVLQKHLAAAQALMVAAPAPPPPPPARRPGERG